MVGPTTSYPSRFSLDSLGVQRATFEGNNLKDLKRDKLFFDATLRRGVLGRLAKQFVEAGFCARKPRVTLGLAAGKSKVTKRGSNDTSLSMDGVSGDQLKFAQN